MKLPSNTPPVFINGRFLTQQLSGVQSFARSICRELLTVGPIQIIVPTNEKPIDHEFEKHLVLYGKQKGHLWEQFELPAYLRKNPGIVLLNLCNTAPLKVRNQVITIHDLAFIHNPDWFHPVFSWYYRFLIPKISKNSRAILTVSNTIKSEIAALLKVSETKILVAGNKVSEPLLTASSVKPSQLFVGTDDYFLMVGSRDPRKNFGMVEELFANGFRGKKLVIAGSTHRNFKNASNELKKSIHVLDVGFVNNSELKWLYENAIAFINPSLYEGFGIPNLEAMALGCKTVCSNIPVFHEICGNAANYFDVNSKESLKNILNNLLDNKLYMQEQVSMGKVIFDEFQSTNRSSIILKALTQ